MEDNKVKNLKTKITKVLVQNTVFPKSTVVDDLANLFIREIFWNENKMPYDIRNVDDDFLNMIDTAPHNFPPK